MQQVNWNKHHWHTAKRTGRYLPNTWKCKNANLDPTSFRRSIQMKVQKYFFLYASSKFGNENLKSNRYPKHEAFTLTRIQFCHSQVNLWSITSADFGNYKSEIILFFLRVVRSFNFIKFLEPWRLKSQRFLYVIPVPSTPWGPIVYAQMPIFMFCRIWNRSIELIWDWMLHWNFSNGYDGVTHQIEE